MSQARRFILTYFVAEGEDWKKLAEEMATHHTYFSCQLELCPTSQRLHIQAYCECKSGRQFSWYGQRKWHAVQVKKDNGASNYGNKERTRVEGPLEFGEKKKDPKEGGEIEKKRWSDARTSAKEGRFCDIDDQIFIQYYSSLKRIHADEKAKEAIKWEYEFHPWQYQIMARLGVIEDRKIIWIYDEIGGVGKTKFSKWLGSQPNSIYLGLEKKENILYMVEKEELIIFDIARSEIEFLNYSIVEKLKDGAWIAGKYEGKKIYRQKDANIIVFSNSLPTYEKLSLDRWEIYQIRNNNLMYIPI